MSIITIDGNIGCGKTGVLNHLHKMAKIPVDLEPIENWQPYLNDIYIHNKNIFNFQIRIWLDRCWVQEKNDINNILVERSPFFIKNAFIKLAKQDNLLSDDEYNTLLYLHKKTDPLWLNNKYIYLRSNPESCIARIKKRNRVSEDNINLEYLKKLHNLHEEAILKLKDVIIIDVENKTIANIATELYEHIK